MANKYLSLVLLIILALLCKFTAATGRRSGFFPAAINATTDHLSANGGGICNLFVTNKGYTCEEHTVTTSDGYILSLQRIPAGRSSSSGCKKRQCSSPPVLLHHGVIDYALTWLLLPPHQSLAFVLADQGYDVWISNVRGTLYSRQHVNLTTNDDAYWDWTWDQQAQFDLPATVHYVFQKTGQKTHCIGHSLGSLMVLSALSKGHVAHMMRSVTSLCPISHLRHMSALFLKIGAHLFLAEELYLLKIMEYDTRKSYHANIASKVCQIIDCADMFTALTGKNCCMEPASVRLYLESEPQPTSVKNIVHFSQMVRRGTLAMFDYGNEGENMKHYGQKSPPNYNMTDIPKDFPLFFSYGGKDGVSDQRDVKKLLDEFSCHDKDKLMTHYVENFAHMDYVMAGAAKEKVYDPVLSFLKLH